ncbi:xanthine dehydrogenase family protein molybdopterin-binding subunit [uncultured Sphingomonas sp.]|uniref:xanthine dehydrogenase family protein molybdopterin-binding subunit n=1 Tax=uncultured Sphingomonas sp. TaxID=158754 RepID=UPI0035CC6658
MLDAILGTSDTNALVMDKPYPECALDTGVQGVIGRPIDRVDGPLKVTGSAPYAAEYAVENLAHGVLVRATVGAGRILSVDVDSVASIPGVLHVVTDFKTFAVGPQMGGDKEAPPQGVQDIAYMGEPIALVVAEAFEVARDAAQRLVVRYEHADGAYDFDAHRHEATRPEDYNLPAYSEQGDIDGAMAAAAFTVDVTYTTPSQNSSAMEPHASIAAWSRDGILTLHGSYQMLPSNVVQLSKALGVPQKHVRIIARYVGGGFGSKLGIGPEAIAAAVAAKQLARPVKVVMARQTVFEATVRRSNTVQHVRLGADSNGHLTAIGHETIATNIEGQRMYEPAGMATHFLYAGANRRITHDLVRLNLTVSGSMRAPGEAVGMLALECAMDELAELTGIDPIELRKRNDPACDPEKQIPFSSRHFATCLDTGADAFGWRERKPVGERREGEWMVGIGMAAAARGNMLMASAAKVSVDRSGHATIETSMTDIGTGSFTILTQVAAEMLGLPVDRITAKLGDSALAPAQGSGGSWGAASSGSAVYLACVTLREKIAEKLDVDPAAVTFKDGLVIADNRSTPIGDLVGDGLSVTGKIEPGKQEDETSQASYGAHFAEVGVNAVTGEVRVRRMLGVFAAGRILNEKTARSQCVGGMTFGIGAALTEDLIHDGRTGKLVNRDLAEYHVPVNADVPQIEVIFVEERDIHANPIHAKGIGELGISGAGAAIANAVYNACGVRVRDFPLTLDKILAGLPAM